MQVVINRCYGGFGLSREAIDLYCALVNIDPGTWNNLWGYYKDFQERKLKRDDPVLLVIVEYLGEDADNKFSELKIVELPDDVEWRIHEYDGMESVAEIHRTWS